MLVYVTYRCPKGGLRSLFETSSKFRMGHSKFHSKFEKNKTMYFAMFCKKRSKTSNKLRPNFDSKFRRSFEQTSKAFLWKLIPDINQHHELLKSLLISDRKSFNRLSKHWSILWNWWLLQRFFQELCTCFCWRTFLPCFAVLIEMGNIHNFFTQNQKQKITNYSRKVCKTIRKKNNIILMEFFQQYQETKIQKITRLKKSKISGLKISTSRSWIFFTNIRA